MNVCFRCGARYRELDNVFEYECRYHTATLHDCATPGAEPYVYACCGVSPRPGHPKYRGVEAAAGCRRAHHRRARAFGDRSRNADDRLCMPLTDAISLLGPRIVDSPAASIDVDSGRITIERHA